MDIAGSNIIGFESSAKGDITFQAENASTLAPLVGDFVEATKEEVDAAVQKSEQAFMAYKAKSNEERANFLVAIAEELLQVGDALIERCMAETALPKARLEGERMRTVNQLKLFAEVVKDGSWIDARIDTALPNRQPIPKPDIRQMHIPLGPVGIFGASNFPLAFSVAGGDTASALAAGCPVVVKAHPLHPGTSELVGKAINNAARKTDMPDGVFSLVQGKSTEVGMQLVNHPSITAIGFTGSFRGGKAIFDAANKRSVLIPVFAEMGSTNPVFILPGALEENIEALANDIINAVNLGVGQFCTNPGLLITNESSSTTTLIDLIKEKLTASNGGTMLSAQIKSNYLAGIKSLEATEGVELLGVGAGTDDGNDVKSLFLKTTGKIFNTHSYLAEEVFGPSSLLVMSNDKEEMLYIAQQLAGHLTATIHGNTDDLKNFSALIQILERKVGRLIFNGFPTGVEVCHSMVHGGPYPATTAPYTTSVGTAAIKRFARPVCYQGFPDSNLPIPLQNANPLKLWRMVDGKMSKENL